MSDTDSPRVTVPPSGSNDSMARDPDPLRSKPHLEVYDEYSILVGADMQLRVLWSEGKQTPKASERYQIISAALRNGYLDKKIDEAKSPNAAETYLDKLTLSQRRGLEGVVGAVTAQTGRAMVEILVLQLAVKAISPEQDVRLHKGNTTTRGFSWREGISMRSLDSNFVTPTLRERKLLRMNKYGAFMTRSFAENYPYTPFYKADMRGQATAAADDAVSESQESQDDEATSEARLSNSKQAWLRIVEDLEEQKLDAEAALLYVLHLLWVQSDAFTALTGTAAAAVDRFLERNGNASVHDVADLITRHIETSASRARLLEVAMHAMMQALSEQGVDLGGDVKPLMPMRTANLKHGNLGDVEVLLGSKIVEAWDAKYGITYLLDDLSELEDKIKGLDVTGLQFGYVLLPQRVEYADVSARIEELRDEYDIDVQVLLFDEWVAVQLTRSAAEGIADQSISTAWLHAYVGSLALARPDRAPIDEPTYDWLQTLVRALD